MHSFVSRDGIDPEELRAVSRKQIEDKYSKQVAFFKTKIVSIAHRGREGFEAVDSANNIYTGRKLVLANGSEDIFPAIEGCKENWPSHI
jgi:thioredoxin reductase